MIKLAEIDFNGYEDVLQDIPLMNIGMQNIQHRIAQMAILPEEHADFNAYYDFIRFYVGTYLPLRSFMERTARTHSTVVFKQICSIRNASYVLLNFNEAFDMLKSHWVKLGKNIVSSYNFPPSIYNEIVAAIEHDDSKRFAHSFDEYKECFFFEQLAIFKRILGMSNRKWPNYRAYFCKTYEEALLEEEGGKRRKRIKKHAKTIVQEIIQYAEQIHEPAVCLEPSWLEDWNHQKQNNRTFLDSVDVLEAQFDSLFEQFRFVNESFLYGLHHAIERHDPNDERALYFHDRKTTLRNMTLVLLHRIAESYHYIHELLPPNEFAITCWLVQNSCYRELIRWFIGQYKDATKMLVVEQEKAEKQTNDDNLPRIDPYSVPPGEKWFVEVLRTKLRGATEGDREKNLIACLGKLYDELVTLRYIEPNNDKEVFIYRFSGRGYYCPSTTKIAWKGKNLLLGYIARCLTSDKMQEPLHMGAIAQFFEQKSGKPINLASAKNIDIKEADDFDKKRNVLNKNFVEAVDLLRKCGFVNVEITSARPH